VVLGGTERDGEALGDVPVGDAEDGEGADLAFAGGRAGLGDLPGERW
jgi:hypothetical protein